MFISGESYKEAELEKCCDYESIEVPDSYTGPHLSFPLLPDHATALLEAFQQKQVRIPKAFPLSAQGCRIDNLALAFLTSSVDWSVTSWPAVKQKETTPGIPVMVFPNSIEMFFFLKMYS